MVQAVRRDFGSIPRQSMSDLWCIQWHLERHFSAQFALPASLPFHYGFIITFILTDILIWRLSGRSLWKYRVYRQNSLHTWTFSRTYII